MSPWEPYVPPDSKHGPSSNALKDVVSVRKKSLSISRNVFNEYLNDPDNPKIKIFVNEETKEIGLKAAKMGHEPVGAMETGSVTVFTKSLIAHWNPVIGRYKVRYDPVEKLVIFKPDLPVLEPPVSKSTIEPKPKRHVCPQGLETPLGDLDICRSRCDLYKRKYKEHDESCRWEGWTEVE